jgi:hypothetical protein
MSTEHILAGILIAIVIGIMIWMKYATSHPDSDRKEEQGNGEQ